MRPLVLVVTLLAVSAVGDWREELTEFVEEVVACRGVVGLSLSVTDNEETLYAEGFGMRDIENNLENDAHTLFGIGSTTKAFSGTLNQVLQEKYPVYLGWDNVASDIVPHFELNTSQFTQYATLRDLVAHRTGLPRNDILWISRLDGSFNREALTSRLRYLPLAFNSPRFQFLYNNWMYMVVGHAAEAETHGKWETLMKEEIFDPLGMDGSTVFVDEALSTGNYARPYVWMGDDLLKFPDDANKCVEPIGPAGSIISNAVDMAKWMRVMLNRGAPLLSEAGYNQVVQPSISLSAIPSLMVPDFPVDIGLWTYSQGWMAGNYRGREMQMHNGAVASHRTLVSTLPGAGVGVFTSTNGAQTNPGVAMEFIHWFAMDLVLGVESWITADLVCSLSSQEEGTVNATAAQVLRKHGISAAGLKALAEFNDRLLDMGGPAPSMSKLHADVSRVLKPFLVEHTATAAVPGRYMNEGYGPLVVDKIGEDLRFYFNDISGTLVPAPPGEGESSYILLLDEGPFQLWFGSSVGGIVFEGDTVTLIWMEPLGPPVFVAV